MMAVLRILILRSFLTVIAMVALFIALVAAFVSSASAESLSTIRDNNRGVDEIQKEKAFQAEKTFLGALAEDPFNAVLHYNLGTAYLAEKKYEAAIKEYDALLRRVELPKELAFAAHFNAAVAAAENKNIDLALKHYQGALDVNPNSKEAKTNIELLTNSAGGGGGGGDKKGESKENGDGQGEVQNGDKDKDKPQKPIDPKDMENILEELGRQEQRIRALEQGNKKGTEKGPSKDW